MKWLIAVALLACGPGKPPAEPPGGGGSASGAPPSSAACDGVRDKVAQLYRAEAKDKDPARVNEMVADNTAMVMNDCVKAPDKVTACVLAATTVRELEGSCLEPLDDEGTEGDKLAH
jgi:hypothetical protein